MLEQLCGNADKIIFLLGTVVGCVTGSVATQIIIRWRQSSEIDKILAKLQRFEAEGTYYDN